MQQEDKPEEQLRNKLFTKDGKPLRILSTSLGIALLANVALIPGTGSAADESGPKLVKWSTEEVKQYYDPAIDWSLPISEDGETPAASTQTEGTTGTGSGGTTIINTSSGFGWDDLLLYHLLFNNGYSYSSRSWSSSHPSYYPNSSTRYKPKTYSSGAFQSKPVAGSAVAPKTSSSTGSITRRSTSSKPGGIGGNSSGFSSSSSSSKSSSSSSSRSSGGFGG
ncbi:hypothetical protein ACFPYJ_11585 [Paenibacillus solisilvae]|uniref:DUF4247 domain-containing protein n=1 Tax=Paenibacillus solisilvae TaxID=2486751 RepID=A0ABW0VZ25_9BACL